MYGIYRMIYSISHALPSIIIEIINIFTNKLKSNMPSAPEESSKKKRKLNNNNNKSNDNNNKNIYLNNILYILNNILSNIQVSINYKKSFDEVFNLLYKDFILPVTQNFENIDADKNESISSEWKANIINPVLKTHSILMELSENYRNIHGNPMETNTIEQKLFNYSDDSFEMKYILVKHLIFINYFNIYFFNSFFPLYIYIYIYFFLSF